jgi:hypothetical protein
MSAAGRLISGEGVMSFALLRAAAAAVLLIASPVGAWAQGGLSSDKAAAQRAAQRSYDRGYQRMLADIAAANAAIRACNYIAYQHAEDAFVRDRQQALIYVNAGAKEEASIELPKYPEDCTPPPRHPPRTLLTTPSPGPAPLTIIATPGGVGHVGLLVQPFVGVYGGGGFQGTNFSVDPQFNFNGSGGLGGGFGGWLLPVPNTTVQIGPRFGIQGSNITGSITSPAASPAFTYNVRTNWMAYEEGLAEIPQLQYVPSFGGGFSASITLSAGVAESGVSVKGTSGMFSVTDNAVRTGITFSGGIELPVGLLPGATGVYLFTQYRGTQWISTVNIPGAVNIGSFTNEVDVGFNFRFVDLTERFPR